jgi:hypothetical protein
MKTNTNERDALAATEARAARAILDHRLGLFNHDDERARRAARAAKQFAAREALAIDEELDEAFDMHELYAFLMMPADEVTKAFELTPGSFRMQYVKRTSLRLFIELSARLFYFDFFESLCRSHGPRD